MGRIMKTSVVTLIIDSMCSFQENPFYRFDSLVLIILLKVIIKGEPCNVIPLDFLDRL